MSLELHQKIEGVLFYKASPLKKAELARLFECSNVDITNAIQMLSQRLQGSALTLIETELELELVTSAELDQTIETLRKDETKRDIGKAGAETLAIILYKSPISRTEIDAIRGVNSSYILRNLMTRGLIERDPQEKGRTFIITPQLLAHLGLENKTQLPNYATVLDQLEAFEKQQSEEENV